MKSIFHYFNKDNSFIKVNLEIDNDNVNVKYIEDNFYLLEDNKKYRFINGFLKPDATHYHWEYCDSNNLNKGV